MSADEAIATAAAEGVDLKEWRSDSASGYKGVHVVNGRYKSTIYIDGKVHYLGIFDAAEEAALVHAREHIRLHPEQTVAPAAKDPAPGPPPGLITDDDAEAQDEPMMTDKAGPAPGVGGDAALAEPMVALLGDGTALVTSMPTFAQLYE